MLKERTQRGSITKCGHTLTHALCTIWHTAVTCPACLEAMSATP